MTDCVANAARNSVTITVPLQILHLATFYVVGHVCMLKVDPKIADALMYSYMVYPRFGFDPKRLQ